MKQLELTFSAPHVHCINCIETIKSQISKCFDKDFKFFTLKKYFQYDLQQKTIQLKVEILDDDITGQDISDTLLQAFAIEDIGQTLQLIKYVAPQYQHILGLVLSVLAGGFWMGNALGFWIVLPWLYPIVVGIHVILLSFLAKDFFVHAFLQLKAGLKNKTIGLFNMDSLFVLSGLVVIFSSLANLFFPVFPNLLELGFFIFGFRHSGILLQSVLDRKIGFSSSLVHQYQYQAYLLAEQNQKVFAKNLVVNQHMIIQKGEVVPIDGKVISSTDDFETRDILATGSYLTSSPSPGDEILAGVECLGGSCVLEVIRELKDSRLDSIDKTVTDISGTQKKAPMTKKIESWLQWFIPAVILLSLSSFLIVSQLFSFALGLQCAIAVLVSACPCTLGMIIPQALRMGAYKASIQQIYFQSSEALQKTAEAQVIVMDYNGTLTEGKLERFEFKNVSQSIEDYQAKQLIYTMEKEMLRQRPSQLLGQKLLQYIESEKINAPLQGICQDLGFGAKLTTNHRHYFFGNNALLSHLEIKHINTQANRLYLIEQLHDTFELIAYYDCIDPMRQDAKKFVHDLLQQKKVVKICTGADQQTAETIALSLEIDIQNIQFDQRMVDKKNFICQLREKNPQQNIMMIGDAINDKEAFREADVSVFLANPNNQSNMSADLKGSVDILSLSGNLRHLAYALQIANDTFYIIKQNLYLSFVYNFISLLLAAGVFLALGITMHPLLGLGLMILQTILLSLNAYRMMHFSQDEDDYQGLEYRNALTAT